jgi:hypothetical protein
MTLFYFCFFLKKNLYHRDDGFMTDNTNRWQPIWSINRTTWKIDIYQYADQPLWYTSLPAKAAKEQAIAADTDCGPSHTWRYPARLSDQLKIYESINDDLSCTQPYAPKLGTWSFSRAYNPMLYQLEGFPACRHLVSLGWFSIATNLPNRNDFVSVPSESFGSGSMIISVLNTGIPLQVKQKQIKLKN